MITEAASWSDAELVLRARNGDGNACEALVHRYLRAANKVAMSVLRNVADAEDVAQEALAAALERIAECRIPERFGNWLLRGVRNRALNQRMQSGQRARILGEIPLEASADGAAEVVLLRRRLAAVMEQLPKVQREVVLLHDVEAWTHPEIAASLGISVVMSRQHLFVARRALREQLAAQPD